MFSPCIHENTFCDFADKLRFITFFPALFATLADDGGGSRFRTALGFSNLKISRFWLVVPVGSTTVTRLAVAAVGITLPRLAVKLGLNGPGFILCVKRFRREQLPESRCKSSKNEKIGSEKEIVLKNFEISSDTASFRKFLKYLHVV